MTGNEKKARYVPPDGPFIPSSTASSYAAKAVGAQADGQHGHQVGHPDGDVKLRTPAHDVAPSREKRVPEYDPR